MLFEMIDGLSWGWLVFAHFIAILIIWTPFIWDHAYKWVIDTFKPLTSLFDVLDETDQIPGKK